MRVLVLGSGVIGTTAAYYLAKAGHEVTVVDRQPGPAQETSFASEPMVNISSKMRRTTDASVSLITSKRFSTS